MTKINIKDWLINASQQLARYSDFPFVETRVLLSFVMEKSREWLVSHPDVELTDAQTNQANTELSRLMNGFPLPYIIGKQAFFGLDFIVSPDVLIPRPETEQLVEECIEWLEVHSTKRRIVDVGTGSGVIAVSLADRFSDLQVTAVDISDRVLDIAQKNANLHHVNHQIVFRQGDLLDNFEQSFHLIAANLPYIPRKILQNLPVSKFEPLLALDGGKDGLELISKLLAQCENHIEPGGLIILEIESDQSNAVSDLVNSILPKSKICILNDLAKHPRILKIQV